MEKIGVILIVLLLFFSGLYFVFDQLGGNNPIEIGLVKNSPPTLVGKTFKGQPQDEKLVETFKSLETLLSLNPGKKIHTIYFQEPGGKLDTMEVFVGLDLPFASTGLETKNFPETSYLRAIIKGSKWVIPSPNTVKDELREAAKEQNLLLSGVFIDRIVSETEVHVIAPIR